MIEFVNAKINIGLQIVERRTDGYHNLQTVFYPVGKYAGMATDPEPFCDILELSKVEEKKPGLTVSYTGRAVDCLPEKNLVYKAARLFFEETGIEPQGIEIRLDKHLPDGAGIGGGSADASFTLRMLARHYGLENLPLSEWAARLGADCPFFIENRPVYAQGIGEKMTPLALDLSGFRLVLVKPDIYVSTREAFSGVCPKAGKFDLRAIVDLPPEEWKDVVKNDFEDSIFPLYPAIAEIKERLYASGAAYASMTGSGSSVYGIYRDRTAAENALREFDNQATIANRYLLKL